MLTKNALIIQYNYIFINDYSNYGGGFMRKILISLMLCAAVLLQCTAGFAYSYVPFVGDGVLSSTPVSVSLTDVDGAETDSMSNAANVSVRCTVRPGGGL